MFYPDKNFIETLSAGERFIFVKVICGLVAADRKITREELLYLKELALKFNVGAENISTMVKTANKPALLKQAHMITDRSKALMLIKDLCMTANTDTDLADEEIDFILDIAEAMNIEPSKVKDINAVVNEYLALSQKAAILLEQEQWT